MDLNGIRTRSIFAISCCYEPPVFRFGTLIVALGTAIVVVVV
jgi:hypothetical protein